MFGVGGPLAAQSRVRSCFSLMVLVEGGEVVNVGVTTEQNRENVDSIIHAFDLNSLLRY